jgi:ribosomal protein S18 acetylase RimI-like enzyme
MTDSSRHATLAAAPPTDADAPQIAHLLRACDSHFVPPLSQRVDIDAYAAKLALHARQATAWQDGGLVGLVALYCNDLDRRTAFITSVSVEPGHARRGIAGRLLDEALAIARGAGMRAVELEVDGANDAALALYRKHGFAVSGEAGAGQLRMQRPLGLA